jgi:signal transduction histidine kinase
MNIFPCIHKTPEYNGTPQINTIIDKNNIQFNDYLKMFIHELRIPLSGISMGIYLLKNNHISDDDKNILDNMNENIVFIEDIFSKFAVIQDGNIELNVFEPFSINILFEKIKHILYCYIKSSEIELDIYISTEIYDWNYGDKYDLC